MTLIHKAATLTSRGVIEAVTSTNGAAPLVRKV
jgi:hypothetical protein